MKKTPIRTCIICRSKEGKRGLLRIVRNKAEGTVHYDPTGKANGRGAYVCNDDKCIKGLKNQKIVNSALNINLDKDSLMSLVEEIEKNNKEV